MWFVIILIVIIGIGVIYAMAEENKATNNSNVVNEKLNNKGFTTYNTVAFNKYSNRIQVRTDMKHKQIAICTILPSEKIDIIKFSDIIECQIIEDSNTIMKGGVGRAVVGGALAGGVGAVVGANTRASQNVTNSLQIRIVTKNVSNSLYTINIITREISKSSDEYKDAMNFANKVYATITAIISKNNESSNCISDYSENQQKIEEIDIDKIRSVEEIKKGKYIGKIKSIEEIKKGEYIDEGIRLSEDDWILGYVYFENNFLIFVDDGDEMNELKEPVKISINIDEIEYYRNENDGIGIIVKTIDKEYIFGNLETYEHLLNVIPDKEYEVYKKNVGKKNNVKNNSNSVKKDNDSMKKDNDDLSQLEKLSELKEKGIITEQEFEESKKKILSKI